jgi:signal peptidase II
MRLLLSVAAVIVAADQATKALARHFLETGGAIPIVDGYVQLTLVRNTGAAFGIFSNSRPIFIIATAVAMLLIVAYHASLKETNVLLSLALAFELGGAAGNLIDRIHLGWVTDFIYFNGFPVFNVADSAITIGVALLILVLILDLRQPKGEEPFDATGTV